MKKLTGLLIALVAALTLMSNFIPGDASAVQYPAATKSDSLHRFDFPNGSIIGQCEGPDGSVLLVVRSYTSALEEIIRYDPVKKSFGKLLVFDSTIVFNPGAQLATLESKKLVYGVTGGGGKANRGLIYSLDVSTGKQTTLYDFANSTNASEPQFGLRRINANMLLGVVKMEGRAQIFTFDIRTNQPRYHPISYDTINCATDLPVMLTDSTCAFLHELKYIFTYEDTVIYTEHTKSVAIVEYNLRSNKVTSAVSPAFELGVLSNLAKAKDGGLYISHAFGSLWSKDPGAEYLFARYDPSSKSITRIQLPLEDAILFGPPISADRDGNIIGAFLYGGTDNGGYVFRFDPVNKEFTTVKDWLNDSPGSMTYSIELLHHTNGKYYSVSHSGGEDAKGRFYSLDPATGEAIALARFAKDKY